MLLAEQHSDRKNYYDFYYIHNYQKGCNFVYSRRLDNISITPITSSIVATSFPTSNGNTFLLNLSCQYASKNVQTVLERAKSPRLQLKCPTSYNCPELDYETKKSGYVVKIKAKDLVDEKLYTEGEMTIMVEDVNEAPYLTLQNNIEITEKGEIYDIHGVLNQRLKIIRKIEEVKKIVSLTVCIDKYHHHSKIASVISLQTYNLHELLLLVQVPMYALTRQFYLFHVKQQPQQPVLSMGHRSTHR